MRHAVGADLACVARERFPAPDLPLINFRDASAQAVSAIPLKPAARVRPDYPAFALPFAEREAAFHFEEIQAGVWRWACFCLAKPVVGEFILAVIAVFAFKNPQRQHFLRRKEGFEVIRKVFAQWFDKFVNVMALHFVAHMNAAAGLEALAFHEILSRLLSFAAFPEGGDELFAEGLSETFA